MKPKKSIKPMDNKYCVLLAELRENDQKLKAQEEMISYLREELDRLRRNVAYMQEGGVK